MFTIQEDGGSNSGSIVMFVIFGLLIALMIGIALYGSYKERNKKRLEITESKKSNMSVQDFYIRTVFELSNASHDLENDLKNFKPSVGKKTMKQISDDALAVVNRIKKDPNYNELKKSDKYYPVIKEVMDELTSTTPTKWPMQAYSAMNIVNSKTEVYKVKYKELWKGVSLEHKIEVKEHNKELKQKAKEEQENAIDNSKKVEVKSEEKKVEPKKETAKKPAAKTTAKKEGK